MTAVVEIQNGNVRRFEITADVAVFAASIGIELGGTLDERADRAAEHMNRSQRHMLASGLLLASIKEGCEHGEFIQLIEERGFEERNARRAMQYAQFVLSRSDDERALLIGLPKSKVLALAGADEEVISQLLADGGERIEGLSVKALMDELRDAKAGSVDLATQRDTAEAEAEALRQQLAHRTERADKVPLVVAELRAEIAAHAKTAQLSIAAFHSLGMDVVSLGAAGAHDWKDATLRLAVSGLMALRLQVQGVLEQYLRELPPADFDPTAMSAFTRQEADEAAERFATLTAVHEYEKQLRKWEREQEQPRGKGRPTVKPKAPKGSV
ncbi:MAG: hypothetical protein K2W93_14180 [Burkholderiaceae bacterium]|nr:hypothetical protein [Burkholderiaceae bacterium]